MSKKKEPRGKFDFNCSVMVNGCLCPEIFPDEDLSQAIRDAETQADIIANKTGADRVTVYATKGDQQLIRMFKEY